MASRFLNSLKINDAYTLPSSDGSNGQVIVTDGSGNLAFADPSTSSSASVIYRDNFTGDGSTVAFTLQNSLSDEDQTFIYIDGVYQEKVTYSLSTNTITFTTAPDTGHSIEVISVSGINVGPTTIYQDNFTGDGTTTDFTLAQSIDNEVKTMIYFNGVYQFKGTYSLNGTALSFDTAPANGVDIEVISIASAAAADYNQKVLFYGKASEAISKGDAIMLAGQEGDHFLLAKATQAAISANHEYFLGLASQDLVQGEFGYVTEFGKITELDTSGYTAGDILWFDAGGSTAGALTTTEPAPPLAKIQVAAVIRSHQNEGVLFIRPTWYHELGELHDVDITSIADKDILAWNNTQGYWENTKTLDSLTANTLSATTLTGTLSTAAQTNITSVGTLSSLSVSGIITSNSSSTGDYVRLYGGSGSAQWDIYGNGENLRFSENSGGGGSVVIDSSVGIGTTSPLVKLDARGSISAQLDTAYYRLRRTNGTDVGYITDSTTWGDSGTDFSLGASSANLRFYTNNSVAERMRIDSSGNVGIGTASPSHKLDVEGTDAYLINLNNTSTDARLQFETSGTARGHLSAGTGLFTMYGNSGTALRFMPNGSTAMYINTSGNVGIGTTTPSQKLQVKGNIQMGVDPTLYWESNTLKLQTSYNAIGVVQLRGSTSYAPRFEVYNANNVTKTAQIHGDGTTYFNGGNVGIGTTSPHKALEVKNSYDGSQLSLRSTSGNAGNAGLRFSIADNTVSSDSYHKASIWLTGDNTGNALGDLTFNVNNVSNSSNVGSSDEKMRLTREGYLGIGTTNPGYGLHVANGVSGYSAGFDESIVIGESGTTPRNLRFANITGAYNTFQQGSRIFQYFPDGNGTAEASIYFNRSNGTGGGVTSGAEISFHTTKNTYGPYGRETDEERMRITQTGNIKLSSTTTQSIDFAYGGGVNKGGIKIDYNTGEYKYYVGESGNTYYKTFLVNDVERMRITSNGFSRFTNNGSYQFINYNFHEFDNTEGGNEIALFAHKGTSNPYGIQVRFTGTAPNNTSNYFYNGVDTGATRYIVYSNGNVVNANNSYGAISDVKLKENIVDTSPKLDDLMQVKIRNYNLIGETEKRLGVIAQELEEVFPSMIDESPDFEEQELTDEEGNVTTEKVDLGTTTKSVKYSVFVPMLIKAMQEQQEIIEELKQRILTLENNNNG